MSKKSLQIFIYLKKLFIINLIIYLKTVFLHQIVTICRTAHKYILSHLTLTNTLITISSCNYHS